MMRRLLPSRSVSAQGAGPACGLPVSGLPDLPDTLRVPDPSGRQGGPVPRPLVDLTLAELAAAIQSLEFEHHQQQRRLHSLQQLYRLARQRGGGNTLLATALAVEHPKEGT